MTPRDLCPFGCDPCPCELCEAQEAKGMLSPRRTWHPLVQAMLIAAAVVLIVLVIGARFAP